MWHSKMWPGVMWHQYQWPEAGDSGGTPTPVVAYSLRMHLGLGM